MTASNTHDPDPTIGGIALAIELCLSSAASFSRSRKGGKRKFTSFFFSFLSFLLSWLTSLNYSRRRTPSLCEVYFVVFLAGVFLFYASQAANH
ncbi:hypothetical protein BD560DRAFT_382728, partial [Blakeslea trispora]